MTERKKINVVIDGRDFTVVGAGEEGYVKELARYVDNKIQELSSKNDKLCQTMSATLAALNIADELHTSNRKLSELESQSREPIEKYDDVTEKYEKAIKEVEVLKKQCEDYKDKFLRSKLESDDIEESVTKYEKIIQLKEQELLDSQKLIRSLQDKVFDNEMDLVETKKELSEIKKQLNNRPEKVKEEN